MENDILNDPLQLARSLYEQAQAFDHTCSQRFEPYRPVVKRYLSQIRQRDPPTSLDIGRASLPLTVSLHTRYKKVLSFGNPVGS
jgi:hypothetical protein